ncbi:hypothetical protein AALP_AAs45666U000100, partial [Arabis alpina]
FSFGSDIDSPTSSARDTLILSKTQAFPFFTTITNTTIEVKFFISHVSPITDLNRKLNQVFNITKEFMFGLHIKPKPEK